ncbi:sel1 repeat family protein [Providencia alcalifaciens]|uniref:sel1 repeat family protein n=1 Tax=Providencia alcalifaciens TaxID=126385 RepID=UPI0004469558|nr:sel1 repeat family protein [Providencia alcalifaciens]EUD08203.1 Sel1 repeat protein [Providencia alcalifaciens R90-1475]
MTKLIFFMPIVAIFITSCGEHQSDVEFFVGDKKALFSFLNKCDNVEFWKKNKQTCKNVEEALFITTKNDVFSEVSNFVSDENETIDRYKRGMAWIEKDFEPDRIKSFDDFKYSANAGYAPAQYELGRIYFDSLDVKIESEIPESYHYLIKIGKAIAYFELSAKQENSNAQYRLYYYYDEAFSRTYPIVENYETAKAKAFYWLDKAEKNGNYSAKFVMAQKYDYCSSPVKANDKNNCEFLENYHENIAKTIELYTFLAENGEFYAIRRLEQIYREGQYGIAKDEDKANKYLELINLRNKFYGYPLLER